MPKTNFCQPQPDVVVNRLEFFSGWLYGLIGKRKDITTSVVGEWLGCTKQNVSYKIANNSFTLKDVLIIFDKLELTAKEIGSILTYGGTE